MGDERWTGELEPDEYAVLSRMVVDFARNVGLSEAQDDDLIALVIAAYLAGRNRPQPIERGWIS